MGSSAKKEELSWSRRHWGLAMVCLAFCCFNAVCFLYAASVPGSRLLRAAELHRSNKEAPSTWKEFFYFMVIIPVSIFVDGFIVAGVVFATLFSKAEKDNLKELKEIVGFGAYDRQYTGTEVYKEVALDFTRRNFAFCCFIYAVAFCLQACFNIFEHLLLTSIALIIFFAVLLTIFFGVSFFMNIKIALRLGVDKQEGA